MLFARNILHLSPSYRKSSSFAGKKTLTNLHKALGGPLALHKNENIQLLDLQTEVCLIDSKEGKSGAINNKTQENSFDWETAIEDCCALWKIQINDHIATGQT